VRRAARVVLEGQDRGGEPIRLDVSGLHARVLQHEADHLNGILFIDRLSPLKRGIFKRRHKKSLARTGA